MDTRKITNHLKENKNAYLAAAGGVAVGAVAVLVLHQRPTIVQVAPVFNNTINNANAVNNGGYMRKIVRCLETDEMWPSVSKAADSVGIAIPAMSRHINGHTDHIDGLHYVIEALASG